MRGLIDGTRIISLEFLIICGNESDISRSPHSCLEKFIFYLKSVIFVNIVAISSVITCLQNSKR